MLGGHAVLLCTRSSHCWHNMNFQKRKGRVEFEKSRRKWGKGRKMLYNLNCVENTRPVERKFVKKNSFKNNNKPRRREERHHGGGGA